MIRIHLPHNYLGLVAGCLCLGSLAVSCVSDDLGCIEDRPGYVEGNDIWLTFTLRGESAVGRSLPGHAASGISRADDSVGHPEEEATVAENHINGNDIRLIVFDNRQNTIKVLDNKDIVSFEINENDDSRYEIKARINRAYFDYAGTSDNIEMSLMLVANLTSGVASSFPTDNDLYMKNATSGIATRKIPFSVALPADGIWYPEGAARCIPMAGWEHYTIPRDVLDAATSPESACVLGSADRPDLVVQRAMAKIRVFDNIDAEASTTITGVRIEGGNSSGAFIPDFSQTGCASWATGTAMVETATVNTSWFDATREVVAREVTSADGGDYTDADGNVFKTAFIAYVTESAAAQDVKLVITTESENDNGSREWEFPFSRIMTQSTDITRNHIYEFTVTRSMSADLNINYTVCPWVSNTINVPPFD